MEKPDIVMAGQSEQIIQFLKDFEQKFENMQLEQQQIIVALMGGTLRKDGGMIKEQADIKNHIEKLEDKIGNIEKSINLRLDILEQDRKRGQWLRTILTIVISFIVGAAGFLATLLALMEKFKK